MGLLAQRAGGAEEAEGLLGLARQLCRRHWSLILLILFKSVYITVQ